MSEALIIRGGRLLDPSDGTDDVVDILLLDDRVAWRGRGSPPGGIPKGCRVLEAAGMVVCPGLVDLHCHLREPGYEEKETIATGTKAAARGGFTALCCMPNTNPPIDTRATVEYIQAKARQEGVVRVLPIGCVTKGRGGLELSEMAELAEAGVVAFSDDGDPVASPHLMRQALAYSSALGLPIVNHCQDPVLSQYGVMHEGWVSLRLGLPGWPSEAEEVMVARDVALVELTGGRLHVAHISTARSVEILRRAKEKGLPVTAEVTPHHLSLTHERAASGIGGETVPLGLRAYDTNTKVNPPLRTPSDVEALIQGLRDGVIDAVATDHAPHTLVDKLCSYQDAAFGISGLETALGSLMGLVHKGALDLPTLIARLTWGPSQVFAPLARLGVGTLREGAPADVTVFDPDEEWVVDPEAFASKGKNTPLAGEKLRGKVMTTIVGGKVVYADKRVSLVEVGRG